MRFYHSKSRRSYVKKKKTKNKIQSKTHQKKSKNQTHRSKTHKKNQKIKSPESWVSVAGQMQAGRGFAPTLHPWPATSSNHSISSSGLHLSSSSFYYFSHFSLLFLFFPHIIRCFGFILVTCSMLKWQMMKVGTKFVFCTT